MRIVLDTNVLLACIGMASPLRWLFDAVLDGRLHLVVSTPILLEYEEVIARQAAPMVAAGVVRAVLALPDTTLVEPRFFWRLPPGDADDEKFVDAYLSAGAEALITHDAHFAALKAIDFPRVSVLPANSLREKLEETGQ